MQLQVVLVALVAAVLAAEEPITSDYHNQIGIPLAAKIKNREQAAILDGSALTGGLTHSLIGSPAPHVGGLVITLTDGKTSVCASSLVSNKHAVTAAHCWSTQNSQASQFVVVLGSPFLYSGGTRITTNSVKVHPNYSPNSLNNDIAVIIIPRPVTYTNNIRPMSFPADTDDNFENTSASAASFTAYDDSSSTSPYWYVREDSVWVNANQVCEDVYGNSVVTKSVVCASSQNQRSICSIASGGPMWKGSGNQRKLIGMNSFSPAVGCQGNNFPSGFTEVHPYVPWVQDQIKTA